MNKSNLRCLVASLAGVSLIAGTLSAQESEKPVKMRDLPTAVRATVMQQSQGATIRGLSKEIEGGNTFYEVSLGVSGHNRDVLIDPSGAVVEIEEEVSMASLPAAVKAELDKHVGRGKVVTIESITKNGAVVAYEAHIKTGRKVSEIRISPEGQLIPDK